MARREFEPIKGDSARRYRYRGEIISRRRRDDILARRAGFKNRGEVERVRLQIRESQPNWLKRVITHTGKRPSWSDYKNADVVAKRRARLIERRGGRKPAQPWSYDASDPELVAPNGPLANYLDAAGVRPKNGRPVGGS